MGSHWRKIRGGIVAVAVGVVGVGAIVYPATRGGGNAAACTQTVTTADMVNSPFNGDNVNAAVQGAGSSAPVICFASGTYVGVDLYNASPTADVTLQPANGAAVTMGTITANHVAHVKIQGFTGSSSLNDVEIVNSNGNSTHITVSGNKIPGTGSSIIGNTGTNQSILLQGNLFTGNTCNTEPCDEKRLKIVGNSGCPSGITIDSNEITGGNTDGMQTGSNCGVTISNNWIHDMVEDPGGNHVDAIQFTGDTDDTVTGNYIDSTPTGIVDYDGPGDSNVISNNVLQNVVGVGSGAINMGSEAGVTVEHNTIVTGPDSTADDINFGSKAGRIQSTGVIVRNNITPSGIGQDGDQTATFAVNDYNMCNTGCTGAHSLTGKVKGTDYSFTGGSVPSTFAGFALASGSLGENAASDGTDMGVVP